LFSQKASDREWAIFQKNIEDYKKGYYRQAQKNIRLVLKNLKDNSLLSAHQLMLAKSHYKMGKYVQSLDECQNFIRQFPESRYRMHIEYLKANNYFQLDRLQTAVETWLSVAEKSKDKRLAEKALKLADQTVRFKLDSQGLMYLKNELKSPFALQFAYYHIAERDYEKGNFPPAKNAVQKVLSLNGNNILIEQKAKKIFDYLDNKANTAIRIAALLPLSGGNADVGQALLDGAQMTVDVFNRENGPSVELIPFDYETRLSTALLQLKEIARDPSISAVFGPVENDIFAACATVADYEKISLISPTATEKDLRTISSRMIQLSIPMDIRVQKIARYAHESMQMTRFATIAPIDDYFVRYTKIFTQKQEQFGNEVVSQQWYYPGDQDITRYFKALKRVGIKLVYQDSVIQADTSLTQYMIDTSYASFQEKERELLEETNTRIDSADIPVKTIDAMFLPVFSDDIGLIASQYAYWNIQAQIFGNADWYNMELLNKNKNYINGLIFVSDGYLNEESWDYRKFRNDFRNLFKRTPNKYELIGYDSFNFILSALQGAPKSIGRENFFERVKDAPTFNGVYRNFDVGKKRYNNAVRILKYTYGQILPLK